MNSNLITSSVDYNPESVDVWFLDRFWPRDTFPDLLQKHDLAIRYVVGRIAVEQAMYSLKQRNDRDGIVPIRWEDVWPLFGHPRTWNAIRKELIRLGILECDEEFEIGSKSKWYKLAWDWRYHEVYRVTIRDPILVGRIASIEGIRSNREGWTPSEHHIDYWLKQVRVDESLIQPWIRQRYRSPKQHQTWLKVLLLQSGLAEIKVDGYWRVHSAVTGMRRAVRSAFRINGEPLIEVDLCNSQPLLIGFIAAMLVSGQLNLDQVLDLGQKQQSGSMFQASIRSAKGSEKEITRGEDEEETIRLPYLLCNLRNLSISPILSSLPKDLVDYLRMCEAGIFNRTMGETWGINYDDDPGKVKRMAFKYILFDRVHPFCSQWKAFEARFPTVAMVLKLIKAEDYGVSSRACQRLESAIMVGTVADRFRLIYPTTPVQTIHDSLLVPQDALQIAREAICDAFAMLGLEPSLKVKGAA